ncbi:hypothetical protein C8F04DRAFT_1204164, partial [Mycena alexandri]
LLPDGLLYYHVVAALDNILDDVAEIWSSEELEELEIFDDWSSFRYLAEKRVQLLHSLQSTRSCDNLETVREDSREVLFPTRQFMRAVVRDDFTENMLTIYQHQVKFIANNPANRFYTLFDYTCNPVQISVESVVDLPISHTLQGGGPDSEWMHILARAEASHGRMHLHVAKVPEGSLTHVWVIPLRTNSPQIHEALFQLGNSVSADYDEEEIVEEVGKILENAVGLVVETY